MAIELFIDDDRPRLLSFPGPQPHTVAMYTIRCQGKEGASWPEPTWCHLQARDLDTLAQMWSDHIKQHHSHLQACGDYYRMTHAELTEWFVDNGVAVEVKYSDGGRAPLA
jgi:hypothetical protein